MEEQEKKVVASYTVVKYDDGSIDVKDAGVEGAAVLGSEEIYKDIEDVAKVIANKRIENAAFVGAYNGTARFYEDVSKRNAAAAEGSEQAAQ